MRRRLAPNWSNRPTHSPWDTIVTKYRAGTDLPPLRLILEGQNAALTVDRIRIEQITYRLEESRGYPAHGDLWSPGFFHVDLRKDCDATLIASSESWENMRAFTPALAVELESERKRRILVGAVGQIW